MLILSPLQAEDQIPIILRFFPQNTLNTSPGISLRRLFQIPGRLLHQPCSIEDVYFTKWLEKNLMWH
jgi:hypothetical protein